MMIIIIIIIIYIYDYLRLRNGNMAGVDFSKPLQIVWEEGKDFKNWIDRNK